MVSFHGGNFVLLDEFVKEHNVDGVNVYHVEVGSEETEDNMRALLNGPTDEHAGNVEISMMLEVNPGLTVIPPNDYPKKVVTDPFKTNRIKDFCEDRIADNHPEWIISKENGQEFIEWTVDDFKKELSKL